MTSALWWGLLALFATPLLRLMRPLWSTLGLSASGLNAALGRFEGSLSRCRELLLILFLGALLWSSGQQAWLFVAVASSLILLARQQRFVSEILFSEWMRSNPRISPTEFYAACYLEYGPAGCPPDWVFTSMESGDYKFEGAKTASRWAVLRVFWQSAWLTHLIIQSERVLGAEYYKTLFDSGARLWSLVILSISESSIKTENMDKLAALPAGKRIFLFNHVSMTDFAFGFSALDKFIDQENKIRLRFIIAKDHFVDNPIIYSLGGIGRCIELVGMIPIDRKNSENAVSALEDAARQAATTNADLAIYPQGTRALKHLNERGECIDVGFYSSAKTSKAMDPCGHCKKGTAFMTLDILRQLKDSNTPVHLVIVGIEGAGRLMPKGTLKITRGVSMRYRIGDVLTLEPKDVKTLKKYDDAGNIRPEVKVEAEELTIRIERALARACRIDDRLKALFESETGRSMPENRTLLRVFDHALALSHEVRKPLIKAFEALPETVTDEDVKPIFEQMLQLKTKK
jgi:1-acyl-sn-glycerol-3-phosphate acyltransferase